MDTCTVLAKGAAVTNKQQQEIYKNEIVTEAREAPSLTGWLSFLELQFRR